MKEITLKVKVIDEIIDHLDIFKWSTYRYEDESILYFVRSQKRYFIVYVDYGLAAPVSLGSIEFNLWNHIKRVLLEDRNTPITTSLIHKENCNEDTNSLLHKILDTLNKHTEDRDTILDSFHAEFDDVKETIIEQCNKEKSVSVTIPDYQKPTDILDISDLLLKAIAVSNDPSLLKDIIAK